MSDSETHAFPHPTFSQEQTDEHIAAMRENAQLLHSILDSGSAPESVAEEVNRIVIHLRTMCAMKHIVDSGTDLKPHTDAAARGAAWLAQN